LHTDHLTCGQKWIYFYDIPEGICAGLRGKSGGSGTREKEDEEEL
jgi:hypothetical protein